jgi:hypothetical protein
MKTDDILIIIAILIFINIASNWWFNRHNKFHLVSKKLIEHFSDNASKPANVANETRGELSDDIDMTEPTDEELIAPRKEIDKYINDFFLAGKFLDEKKPHPTTQEQQEFKKKYFEFRDNVYQNSSQFNTGDRVDKMRAEKPDFSGMNIAGVYDDLVRDYKMYDTQKIKVPNVDDVTKIPYYTIPGANGKYIPEDVWVYDVDKVMNGARFYGNTYPSDNVKKEYHATFYSS